MNAMWRLTMFLMCLVAALCGTPLRQAEAASDFARSIAEFGQGDVVEPIDGGVGDDQETSILKAGDTTDSLTATILPAMADVGFALPGLSPSFPDLRRCGRADRCRTDTIPSDQRIA